MDTNDRNEANLPARVSSIMPPAVAWDPGRYDQPGGSQTISPKVLARGIGRHWWRILLLWLIVSAPAAYLLYAFVEPTYEAYSVLRIEPSNTEVFGPLRGGLVDFRGVEPYLKTQVNMITSDLVLKKAIANALVRNRPMLVKSLDPKTELQKKLGVTIVEDAYLIRVALESTDPSEAAAIVNAVVGAYTENNKDYTSSAKGTLRASLEAQKKILDDGIEKTKKALEDLAQKGTVKVTQPKLNLSPGKDRDDSAQPTFTEVGQSQMERIIAEMTATDLDIIRVGADVEARKKAAADVSAAGGKSLNDVDPDLQARIIEEFRNDPDVVAIADEMVRVQEELTHNVSINRRLSDPATVAARRKLATLEDERKQLWSDKYWKIHDRLLNPNPNPESGSRTVETIPELELRLESLKTKRASLAQMYQKLEYKEKAVNTDSFQFAYLNHELQSLMNRREQVARNLAQVEFEASQEAYRISQVNPAEDPKIPSNNKRLKYMAMAAVGVLFAVLALFLMLEVKAERVADLEALSSRVRSEVYALPPLPTARSLRKLSVLEADDQVEQFIQRLDHLRFAVCGESVELGKGRCVLITSAIGGEGKTTLAAQLAARCGNAGMSTLLIDADLRRTSLATLLDIPEGPGLSDVLKDEAMVDDVVIPVQGGTFHVLPAGLPIQDTSRVLQNRKFGLLVAQFRQVYDLIIIDSPPVLPVPDALILGRWADGAVLAARYDISRFPQVERARRQLDNAGIPVLGTVINGMRNTDTYYGRYTYSRRRSVQPDSTETI